MKRTYIATYEYVFEIDINDDDDGVEDTEAINEALADLLVDNRIEMVDLMSV